MDQRAQPRRLGQFGDEFGRDQPFITQHRARRLTRSIDGGPLCDDADHHWTGGRATCGTIALATPAAEPVTADGKDTDGAGAAFGDAAGIGSAHGASQRGQTVGERLGVGSEHRRTDLGQAAVDVADHHLPIRDEVAATAHRGMAGAGHDLVDAGGELASAHHAPPRNPHRQLRIHPGPHVVIDDQASPKHQGAERRFIDVTGDEARPTNGNCSRSARA